MKADVKAAKVNLTSVGRKMARAIERRALRVAGKELQRQMKQEAPVLSGALRKSIKVRAGKRSRLQQTVNVDATVPYAKKIEDMYGFASIASQDSQRRIFEIFKDTVEREASNL